MHAGMQSGSFRRAYMAAMLGVAGLLGACSQAVRKAPPPPPPPSVDIGVPACNAYLSRYLACHRAARIFPGDSLQSHYQAMLASLQQSAADPQVRPYLAARCIGMSQQLNASLQGRPCTPTPVSAPPASTQH